METLQYMGDFQASMCLPDSKENISLEQNQGIRELKKCPAADQGEAKMELI